MLHIVTMADENDPIPPSESGELSPEAQEMLTHAIESAKTEPLLDLGSFAQYLDDATSTTQEETFANEDDMGSC